MLWSFQLLFHVSCIQGCPLQHFIKCKGDYIHAIASQWFTDHSQYVLPPFKNKCLNFMRTLVQSCTTTKLTLILEQRQLKKKMIHAVPSPWTVNPDQALICWQRSSFLINEVCNLLTIRSFCAVSPKSRWASLWQRNWRSMIRIRLLGLVDET